MTNPGPDRPAPASPTSSLSSVGARVEVDLGDRSYDIHIGPGLLAQAGDILRPLFDRPATVIVTDETVAGLHLDCLQASLNSAGIASDAVILPPGEQTKCFAQLESLTETLLEKDVERRDMVLAFGGGVIGDLTGFAAAILRRGVAFAQIPTTLLAQVDSSVGGKVAINARHGKNLVGAFHQPKAVLCDIDVLTTLPEREFLAGYAEVVKYGLLGDAAFFDWLEANGEKIKAGDGAARLEAIRRSCTAKARIVAADERETGQRALLNLGHTFGHALEAETGYGPALNHGEGVAIGMVLAFKFAQFLGQCPGQEVQRMERHLQRMGLPTALNQVEGAPFNVEALVEHMYQDKKVSDGQLTFVLTRGIGAAFVQKAVDPEDVHHFLKSMV